MCGVHVSKIAKWTIIGIMFLYTIEICVVLIVCLSLTSIGDEQLNNTIQTSIQNMNKNTNSLPSILYFIKTHPIYIIIFAITFGCILLLSSALSIRAIRVVKPNHMLPDIILSVVFIYLMNVFFAFYYVSYLNNSSSKLFLFVMPTTIIVSFSCRVKFFCYRYLRAKQRVYQS
jgi:hypothetical protein